MSLRAAPDEAVQTPPGRRRAPLVAVAVILALVVTAVIFYRWGSGQTPPPRAAATPSRTPTASPAVPEIYNALAPSVVSILATGSGDTGAAGTGVIVNADATIMTAYHVIKGAKRIEVRFADGTTSAATVASADPKIDIAALAPATLPEVVVPAVLGGGAAVGETVIAIGDQLGLTRTTTTGVVSGLDRSARGDGGADLTGLIQFDAAVNHGSSGGPLVNGRGQLVGIVVALANPTTAETFIGVGFAVPIGAAVGARGGDRAPQQ